MPSSDPSTSDSDSSTSDSDRHLHHRCHHRKSTNHSSETSSDLSSESSESSLESSFLSPADQITITDRQARQTTDKEMALSLQRKLLGLHRVAYGDANTLTLAAQLRLAHAYLAVEQHTMARKHAQRVQRALLTSSESTVNVAPWNSEPSATIRARALLVVAECQRVTDKSHVALLTAHDALSSLPTTAPMSLRARALSLCACLESDDEVCLNLFEESRLAWLSATDRKDYVFNHADTLLRLAALRSRETLASVDRPALEVLQEAHAVVEKFLPTSLLCAKTGQALAAELVRVGNDNDAETHLRTALLAFDQHTSAHRLPWATREADCCEELGRILLRQETAERTEEALKLLTRATVIREQHVARASSGKSVVEASTVQSRLQLGDVMKLRGTVRLAIGDLTEAIIDFKRAHEQYTHAEGHDGGRAKGMRDTLGALDKAACPQPTAARWT